MKLAAVLLNFFLPGAGTLLAMPDKRVQGALWLLGAIGLSYVEQVAVGMQHPAFWPMFVSVLVFNTGFALDTWKELSASERRSG